MKKLYLLSFLILTGCMSVHDMQALSSGHVGCRPDEITIKDSTETSITYNWTAICNHKTYICNQDLTGFDQTVNCTKRE